MADHDAAGEGGAPAPLRRSALWPIAEATALLVLLGALWSWLHPPVPSLLFHGISREAKDVWTLPPEVLEATLLHCEGRGYRVVDGRTLMAELAPIRFRRPPLVLLTFDDGCPNQLDEAMPLLEKHGARATFFVNTDAAAPVRWTDDEIRRAHGRGWHVQSHAHRHESLVRRADESIDAQRKRVRANLGESMRRLTELVGSPPRHLAFPCGEVDELVREEARALGFRYMYGCDFGYVTSLSDPSDLPRLILNRDATAERIGEILDHPFRWARIRLAAAVLLVLLLLARRLRRPRSPAPLTTTS